jgi:hypothetical protein
VSTTPPLHRVLLGFASGSHPAMALPSAPPNRVTCGQREDFGATRKTDVTSYPKSAACGLWRSCHGGIRS